MNVEGIKNLIQDQTNAQNLDVSSLSISSHRHNGADSPQIQSKDLLPYPINVGTSVNTAPTGPTTTPDGTIQFYLLQGGTLKDWGLDIALGGVWNQFTIFASALGANQATPQTFNIGVPTGVIYDNIFYDLANEYDNAGDFTATTDGQYLVTASISFLNAGGSGSIKIQIFKEHQATPLPFMTKTIHVDSGATTITADVTGIVDTLNNDLLFIVVTNNTNHALTSLTDDNSWINIQKQK